MLPDDFKLFLSAFGTGDFPFVFGGGFFDPDEIIAGCAGPILMLVGTDKAASQEDHTRFYISRGRFNPNPAELREGITSYGDVDLFDLVQIGYDGMSCYYQLICPPTSRGLSFCRISPEGTLNDRHSSFAKGLEALLSRFRKIKAERM